MDINAIEEQKEKLSAKMYVVKNTMGWCAMALEQGNATLETSREWMSPEHSWGANVIIPPMLRIHMLEDFFVYSVSQMLGWGKKIEDDDMGQFTELINKIQTLAADRNFTDIRNMRVHYDDYYEGAGRNQSRFVHENRMGSVDASSTIVLGDDQYMIGGRLNLHDTMIKCEALLTDLTELMNDITKQMRILMEMEIALTRQN